MKNNDQVIDKILKTFYTQNTKKKVINEAESNFKGAILKGQKTKPQFFWFHSSLPATFDIDFKYKVIFNKNVIEDFSIDGKFSLPLFENDVTKPNFSEPKVWQKAKNISVPGFKVVYVTYNSEYTYKTLNPKRTLKYDFKHTVTLQATDPTKVYKRSEIMDIAQKFVDKFEQVAYQDTKYYKITK